MGNIGGNRHLFAHLDEDIANDRIAPCQDDVLWRYNNGDASALDVFTPNINAPLDDNSRSVFCSIIFAWLYDQRCKLRVFDLIHTKRVLLHATVALASGGDIDRTYEDGLSARTLLEETASKCLDMCALTHCAQVSDIVGTQCPSASLCSAHRCYFVCRKLLAMFSQLSPPPSQPTPPLRNCIVDFQKTDPT